MSKPVRYAVVGLGYISQIAVLPAFAHAKKNSRLACLISDDPVKLRELGKKYGVDRTYSYEQYEECLYSGDIDAVYIALPNHLHSEYAIQAADAGIHVLCEKPMAMNTFECQEMIRAATLNQVKLMIAYRLHFEKANLKAVEIVQSGAIGEPRMFQSVFSMQVQKGNIRLDQIRGGGTLYDIGIYCINAARYLFRDEPIEVIAFSEYGHERRFCEVDEMTSAILRFPHQRLASFTCSFGAEKVSSYQIIGTKGDLRVDPAFEFADELKHTLTVGNKIKRQVFSKRDQFAPELLHFSECILKNKEPQPSGKEGMADVRIIEALLQSARIKHSIVLDEFKVGERPSIKQERRSLPVKKNELIHAAPPSG